MCVQSNIANVLDDMGKLEEALEMHQDVLRVRVATLGPEHPLVADTLYNIGGLYKSQELFELAAESFEKCVPIYSSVHGTDHAETIDAQSRAESARRHAEFEERMNGAAEEIHDSHAHP